MLTLVRAFECVVVNLLDDDGSNFAVLIAIHAAIDAVGRRAGRRAGEAGLVISLPICGLVSGVAVTSLVVVLIESLFSCR